VPLSSFFSLLFFLEKKAPKDGGDVVFVSAAQRALVAWPAGNELHTTRHEKKTAAREHVPERHSVLSTTIWAGYEGYWDYWETAR